MKQIHIYVQDSDHEFLRQEAFKAKQSISRLVRDLIRDTRKVIAPTVASTNTPSTSTSIYSQQEKIIPKKVIEKKNIKTCSHGAMIGLCRHGCLK